MYDILQWQEGDMSAEVFTSPYFKYSWQKVTDFSGYVGSRRKYEKMRVNKSTAMRNIMEEGWKPLNVTTRTVGFWFWKDQLEVWTFVRRSKRNEGV